MWKKLFSFLSGKHFSEYALLVNQDDTPIERDLLIAVSVVLFEIVGVDATVDEIESRILCQELVLNFGVSESELPTLIQDAILARKDAGKMDSFVAMINQKYNTQQRQRLFAIVLKLMHADGRIDKQESRMTKQIESRFQLSNTQISEVKQFLGL